MAATKKTVARSAKNAEAKRSASPKAPALAALDVFRAAKLEGSASAETVRLLMTAPVGKRRGFARDYMAGRIAASLGFAGGDSAAHIKALAVIDGTSPDSKKPVTDGQLRRTTAMQDAYRAAQRAWSRVSVAAGIPALDTRGGAGGSNKSVYAAGAKLASVKIGEGDNAETASIVAAPEPREVNARTLAGSAMTMARGLNHFARKHAKVKGFGACAADLQRLAGEMEAALAKVLAD